MDIEGIQNDLLKKRLMNRKDAYTLFNFNKIICMKVKYFTESLQNNKLQFEKEGSRIASIY